MFKGKTAIVTGGSRGIGRAIALMLCQNGASTAILYAGNTAKAEETVEMAKAFGGDMTALKCDVSDSAEVKSVTDSLLGEWGKIDILVNCAGITRDGLFVRMKDEDFDDVIAANLRGTFLMSRACAASMMKKREGRIVNIASVIGLMGNAGQANYAASKAGIIALTKSVAKELATRNVTCNAVAPGFIESDMTAAMADKAKEATLGAIPMKRIGTGEDVAEAVKFLCSNGAAYITGEVIRVDGGLCM